MGSQIKNDLRILKKSFALIQSSQPLLMPLGVLTSVYTALYPFVNIYLASLIVDRLVVKNWPELLRLALITVAANLVFTIVRSGLENLKAVQEKTFYQKQKQITANKVMELDYESLESAATHDKLHRLDDMHEITGMRLEALAKTLSRITEQIIKTAAAVLLLINGLSAQMLYVPGAFFSVVRSPLFTFAFALAIGLLIALDVVVVLRSGKHHFKLYEELLPFNKIKWYYDRQYLDTQRTGKEIRIFKQIQIVGQSYDRSMADYNQICRKIGTMQGRFTGMSRLCSVASQGAIYLYVSLRALAGMYGIGSIVKYVGYIRELYVGVEGTFVDIVSTKQLLRWLRLYWDFMDTENVNYKGTLPVEKRNDFEYEIEFRNVSFRYPGASDDALKNVSLRLHIGERLAVVGRNGSGKTTFIKLLCRLYDPTEGEITLNGIDIKKYDYKEYRSLFSVVFQDFKLFSFTLGQNIAAQREYDADLAGNAADKAGLRDRIQTLPEGLDTYLYNNFGESGVEISGGEAQKIALARALYKDAPFVVLDEPTAALDPIAEYEVYSKFDTIVGERTAVYISHRLSSCRFCDDIAVFDEGRLVQRGSHDALVSDERGMYRSLWHAQAQYYAENHTAEQAAAVS